MSGIWLSSCKTSRNIDTQKQIDYSGDFLYLRNLIESLRLDVNKQTKITTDKLRDLKIENTTVYLSAPDSTGKQYPVKESITTATKQDQERTEVDETLSLTLQQFSNRLDTISSKVNAILSQKEKVVGFFVKFGGTSSIVNKESWLSVVCFLPYCTSAFLPL